MESVLHISQKEKQKQVKYHFCLIRCDKNNIREADFIEFLFQHIMEYALTYSELHPKKLTEKEIIDWFKENAPRLVSKAKGAFLTKSTKTGEFGELFLFIALESQGFIRLINKMSIKTSPELHFQGWDAVHIGVDDNKNILFCYGSSKMHKDFSAGLSEIFKEIEKFTKDDSKEKVEISLISSYIDSERFDKYSEEIPRLLSPYYRHKERVGKAHPIFLGYEWDFLQNPHVPKYSLLDSHLCSEYDKKQEDIMSKFDEKISSLTLVSNRDFLIWIMPFKDVGSIRSKFIEKLKEP